MRGRLKWKVGLNDTAERAGERGVYCHLRQLGVSRQVRVNPSLTSTLFISEQINSKLLHILLPQLGVHRLFDM